MKPDDTEVELASSPCQMNEVDPTYMGLEQSGDRSAARRHSPGEKPDRKKGRADKLS